MRVKKSTRNPDFDLVRRGEEVLFLPELLGLLALEGEVLSIYVMGIHEPYPKQTDG